MFRRIASIVFLVGGSAFAQGISVVSDTNVLLEQGRDLAEKEAANLEAIIERSPDDLSSRTMLLSYYYNNRSAADPEGQQLYKHLLWIIKEYPGSEIAERHITHLDSTDGEMFNRIKELWLEQVESHKQNPLVAANAANFFKHSNVGKEEALLIRAQEIEPDNPKWAERLGINYLKRLLTAPSRDLALKALQQFEKALKDTTGEKERFHLAIHLAKCAIEAEEFAKARTYAEQLLKKAPDLKDHPDYARAFHQGNVTLGRLALAEGNVRKAKKMLLTAAQPPDYSDKHSFVPDVVLARKLLEKGEKDAVITYLQACRTFWTIGTDRLNGWVAEIKEAAIPDFDVNTDNITTAIFTTGLNERERPIDNIEEISINEEKVYIFTHWHAISKKQHKYKCTIFDGAGNHVFTNEFEFTPKSNNYHTWTWHTINKYVNKAGDWKFQIYLDGEKKIEKTLIVLDQFGERYDPARIQARLEKSPLLKKALERYSSIQSYRDSTVIEMSMQRVGMENKTISSSIVAFERPNRIRIESNAGVMNEMTLMSDGKKIISYHRTWKQYMESEAQEILTAHDLSHSGMSGSVMLSKVLLSNNPVREFLEHATDVVEIEHTKLNGDEVAVIEITTPAKALPLQIPFGRQLTRDVKFEVWIGIDDFLIRRITAKVSIDEAPEDMPEKQKRFIQGLKIQLTETHHDIQVDKQLPQTLFTLTLPEDTELVDRFMPPGMSRTAKSALVDKPAPDFLLKNLDDKEVRLADFKGKVLILDFWATWCAPCVRQMPNYVALQSQYESKGFTMIGISTDEDAKVVRQFAKKHKLNFPLLMANEEVKRDYGGIHAIPTTFVVDKHGIIRHYYRGGPPDELIFQRHVQELLGEETSDTTIAEKRQDSVSEFKNIAEIHTKWLSSDDYEGEFERQVENQFYPKKVEGRNRNGKTQFRAVFATYPNSAFQFFSHHGLSSEEFKQREGELKSQGFERITKQTFNDATGTKRVQASWVRTERSQSVSKVRSPDNYDEPPRPVGGFATIQRNLTYPKDARRAGLEGKVIVNVLISETGKVKETTIIKGMEPSCNQAAIDAIKSTKWQPAKRKGQPLETWVAIPVIFRLKT